MKKFPLVCFYVTLILFGCSKLSNGQNPRQMMMCPLTFLCPCVFSCPEYGYAMGYCYPFRAIKCCPFWVVNFCARSRSFYDP